jgi:hypothetical protein
MNLTRPSYINGCCLLILKRPLKFITPSHKQLRGPQ